MLHCTHGCQLAWLHPQPSPVTLVAAYSQYYTHHAPAPASSLRRLYNRMRHAYLCDRFAYPRLTTKLSTRIGGRLLALLPHRRAAFDSSILWQTAIPGGKLLEIGCGNGGTLACLSDFGWQTQGIEADPIAAKFARQRGLNVINGDAAAQTFNANTFDAIIMSHVIEHVSDPAALIKRCHVWLKPGGHLTLLTPNFNALGHRLFKRHWLHLDAPRHLHIFSRNALTLMCRQTGFTHTESTSTLRDANWTLAASTALRMGRPYRIGQLTRLLRWVGMILLYCEYIAMLFAPDLGEDLLITSHKDKSTTC
ncbi:MAG: putative SAM-dependent methyltransferase [Rhodocyclales bacterium]|nr:putative SAM-dependent methyltransferase [Rhodocyclales bacterium]